MDGSDERSIIAQFLRRAFAAGVIDLATRLRLVDYLGRFESPHPSPEAGVAQSHAAAPDQAAGDGVAETGADAREHLEAAGIDPQSVESDVDSPDGLVPEPVPASRSAPELVMSPPPAMPDSVLDPPPDWPARGAPTPALPPRPTTPIPPRAGPAREPSKVGVYLSEAWGALASDIAVHGFAYLGVVLTFVGILGFLLFAFADLPDAVQPFVELFIASVFFGWAWMLRRQRADRVADGMELTGGMVVPLIVFAALADDAPPDLTGGALILGLTTASLVVAGVYTWLSARKPASMLRFLVGPLIWLAVMTLAFVFKTDEFLASEAITRLVSPQPALASLGIAITVVAALVGRSHRLAEPTVKAALVGIPAAYLLTVSLALGEDWRLTWPIVLLGLGTLVSAESLARWFDRQRWMAIVRPVLLAGVLAPLAPTLGAGWSGVAVVFSYVALYEYEHRAGAGLVSPSWLTWAGLGAGLIMSLGQPVAALVSFGLATVWAHARRLDDGPATPLFNAGAAVMPVGILWSLGELFGMDAAWLVMATLVAALTVTLRLLESEDDFWRYWMVGALVIIGVGATAPWPQTGDHDYRAAVTLVVVSAGLATGTRWPVIRLWLAAAAASGALALGLATADVEPGSQRLIWAAVGLATVMTANSWRRGPASHLAAVGHIAASAATASLVAGGATHTVLTLWALGWMASAAGDELGGETLSSLLARVAGRAGPWLVPVALTATIPPAMLSIANRWPEFALNRSWTGVLTASIGLLYVLVSRADWLRSQLRRVIAAGAVVASVIGVSVAAPDSWPTIYAASALIAIAALLSSEYRQAWFVWFAWMMTVVVVLLLAHQAGVPGDLLHLVGLVWGGTMLVGGLLTDDVRSGRRGHGQGLRTAWLRYPVLLGAIVVPVSLGPSFRGGPDAYGWWAIGSAIGYFGVAWLIRVGSVTAPGYALSALGLTALSPRSLIEDPWLFSFLAGPMVALSWFAQWRQSEASRGWLRWDLAPLVVAHGVGVVALAFAAANGGVASTAFAFGLLSVFIGLWRRQRAWEEIGNLMILLGAWDLGSGWLAIALVATSARGAVGARLAREESRVWYHAIATSGAGLAWLSLLDWLDADPLAEANGSVLLFGGLALSVALFGRWWRLRFDSASWWGGLALLGTAGAAFHALRPGGPGIHGPWVATGLVLLAAAFEISAEQRERVVFQTASVVTVGLAWLAMLMGLRWGAPEAYDYTALVFGGLALVAAILGRKRWIKASNARRWGTLGAAGVTIATFSSLERAGEVLLDGPELAVGVALTSIALEVSSPFVDRVARYFAIPVAGTAWVMLVLGLGWDTDLTATWTGVAYGVLAIGAGEYVRARGADDLNVARGWAALGALGVVSAALLSFDAGDIESTGYWIAGSLALLAVAAARGARPHAIPLLRDGSGLTALASMLTLAYAARWSGDLTAIAVLMLATASTFVSLVVWRHGSESLWLQPLIMLGAVANAIAAALALGALPDQTLLIGVLLSVGVQVIAVGLTRSLPGVLSIGPPLLGGAFLLSVSESVGGSAQWFTAPLGIVLLAEVEIFRKLPRFSDSTGDRSLIVLLEWIGLGILAAPPMVEMFVVSLFAGLIGLATALVVFFWGIFTRVRRRVVAAASLAVATLVLSLFAAAAGSAPASAFFWIVAVGTGSAVMLVAGLVEAYRSKKGKTMARVDQLMDGWE